ncbi:2-dehydro-3-deoxy-D-gluconate 5-dehydrogenase KduD [Asanoa siamensis]|uniref:2-deoxy-D-gluconate 3-dehydrogenase n=1 Tax=Asanoa siamensis TaxID=926357 RepID=A0ABQ4D2E5_9ACTN|nr:2-dehydro-3-deoxy-D-gluconate 5-dehydrogenase KduD [Asanoa siamensis]GIF77676.1 2-deoxy-D-gluconate 3-dehydrogenase [Asanoa siamensis]
MNLFDLTGKIAVVTGGRRGIGLAIADALAAAGADIIGVSASLEAFGSEVEARVRGHGQRFHAYRADFADRKAVVRFLGDLAGDGHQPDILVNNAGTIRRMPAVHHGDDDWDEVIAVNLSSQFVLTRELGRQLIDRGSGKIIFIASLLSFQGGITVPGYTAAKSGILGLTRALSNEWAAHGVNVNAIAPGYIATDNTAALRADPGRNQAILQRIPAGRWGEPADLAGAAVFLASRASDYVNGSVITVDGGWLGR